MMALVQTNYKRQKRFNDLYVQELERLYVRQAGQHFDAGYKAGYELGVQDTKKGDSANDTGQKMSTVWSTDRNTEVELLREVL
jgi:hypothetical protein